MQEARARRAGRMRREIERAPGWGSAACSGDGTTAGSYYSVTVMMTEHRQGTRRTALDHVCTMRRKRERCFWVWSKGREGGLALLSFVSGSGSCVTELFVGCGIGNSL